MTTKRSETTICDRCGNEIEKNYWDIVIGCLRYVFTKRSLIGKLYFMKKQNGGGSARSDMSLDLCAPCTELFLFFMSGK